MLGIEIIPNFHPIFVHFTVALLSLSVAFHLLDFVTKGAKAEWRILAQWNLWLGTGFAIVTVLAGIYAYNTVSHDGPSHAAMTLHRNWALPTLLVFLVLAGWSFMNARAGKVASIPFLLVLVVAGGLLLSTAWHGAELVYRHGLGVMSLPQSSEKGHGHADGHDHDDPEMSMEGISMDDAQGSASVAGDTTAGMQEVEQRKDTYMDVGGRVASGTKTEQLPRTPEVTDTSMEDMNMNEAHEEGMPAAADAHSVDEAHNDGSAQDHQH